MAHVERAAPCIGIFGPSGSGKSSLLRAGVVPAIGEHLRRIGVRAKIAVARPVDEPFPWPPDGATEEHVLAVDQLEDVFVSFDAAARDAFLARLGGLAARPRIRLVIVMRDDFYSLLADHKETLLTAIARALVPVPRALPRERLREMIAAPAAATGITLDPPDLDAVIADAAIEERPGPEPATAMVTLLPLLEVTLATLWRLGGGWTLRRRDFDDIGLTKALGERAEAAYGRLSPAQAQVADALLIELIDPARAPFDKGRRVAPGDLVATGVDGAALQAVIERFTEARILAADGEHVELIHDALLKGWHRYRTLRDDYGELVALRANIEPRAANWQKTRWPKSTGYLLGGDELDRVARWRARGARFPKLGPYLAASRRSRALGWTAAATVVIALAAATLTFRWIAAEADAEQRRAERASRIASSGFIAAQASQRLTSSPWVAMRVLATAVTAAPESDAVTGAALRALLDWRSLEAATGLPGADQIIRCTAGETWVLRTQEGADGGRRSSVEVLSPRGSVLRRIDLGEHRVEQAAVDGAGRTIAGVSDGRLVVAALEGGTWRSRVAGDVPGLKGAAFLPDGTIVVSTATSIARVRLTEGSVQLTELWRSPTQPARRRSEVSIGLAVGEAGTIALVLRDETLVVWREDDVRTVPLRPPVEDETSASKDEYPVIALAIDDASGFVAVGLDDEIIVVDRHSTQIGRVTIPAPLNGFPPWVTGVAFAGPDELVTSHFDGSRSTIARWGLARGGPPCPGTMPASGADAGVVICVRSFVAEVPNFATALRVHEDRISLISGELASDGADARVWFFRRTPATSVVRQVERGANDAVRLDELQDGGEATPGSVHGHTYKAVARGRSWIAAADETTLYVWRAGESAPSRTLPDVVERSERTTSRFASGTRSVISGGTELVFGGERLAWDDGDSIHVLDPRNPRLELATLPCRALRDYAISPDGALLVAACGEEDDTRVQAWSLRARVPLQMDVDTHLAHVDRVAFSPDGHELYIGSDPWLVIDMRIDHWAAALCRGSDDDLVRFAARAYLEGVGLQHDGCGDLIDPVPR